MWAQQYCGASQPPISLQSCCVVGGDGTVVGRAIAGTLIGWPRSTRQTIPTEAPALRPSSSQSTTATVPARIANAFRLSAFDLDLLALAVLPCFDEDAAASIAMLSGGPRRLSVGSALAVLFGAHADPFAVRGALHDSPLWRAGLLRAEERHHALLERSLDPTLALLAGVDGRMPAATTGGWPVRALTAPLRVTNTARPKWRSGCT